MNVSRRLLRLRYILALVVVLSGCVAVRLGILPFPFWPAARTANATGLQGVWVQARSLTTPETINAMLNRAEMGRFNAIFVNVFYKGQTLYDSELVSKYQKVEPGFDPLAYLVPEAHRRNIEVHAWFVAGRVGYDGAAPILAQHPDWRLAGPDGNTIDWLNFSRPDVRQFMSDLMIETVERYDVDGIHFDYTRYPGPEWGFDSYSSEAFTNEYGLDLNQLRYADLPAYGVFAGNPLIEPGSARVLATFANGLPAVTFNSYGEGKVILLNWNASGREVAIGAEIIQRSLRYLLDSGGRVYVLNSKTNAREYGSESHKNGMAWLTQLGWQPLEATESDIKNLTADSVLVLPNVYRLSSAAAYLLADFVNRGGGVIFIDGPTPSIHLKEIQALTGMQSRGKHFKELMLMTAADEHFLIPTSQRTSNLEVYQEWDSQWKEFRRRSINRLINDIHDRVKAVDPEVDVSVTITSDQEEAAQKYLQDWSAWLEGGYVDFLIPRGYVEKTQDLSPVLADWQPAIQTHSQIAVGLKAFTGEGKSSASKTPDQLLLEIEMARTNGSNGIVIFDLSHLSSRQLWALATGPFSSPATPGGR